MRRPAKAPLATRSALAFAATLISATVVSSTGCVPPPERGDGSGQRGGSAGADEAATGDTATAGAKRTSTIPADGWNDNIAWRGLDEGIAEAQKTGMPLMMVVHTAWCGNCKKLKGTFTGDANLERLSEQFVMVHVDQDEHPEATLYGPDGQYIPRVMFLDDDGNVDQGLQNPNRPSKYRYFYTPQEDLVATMRQALTRHGNKS